MSNGPAPVPHPIPPPAPDPDPGVPEDPQPGGPPAPWKPQSQAGTSTFVDSIAGEEDPGAGADLALPAEPSRGRARSESPGNQPRPDQDRMIDKPL